MIVTTWTFNLGTCFVFLLLYNSIIHLSHFKHLLTDPSCRRPNMYIPIHIFIYTYTSVCIYIYIYIHIYRESEKDTCIHLYMYTHIHTQKEREKEREREIWKYMAICDIHFKFQGSWPPFPWLRSLFKGYRCIPGETGWSSSKCS